MHTNWRALARFKKIDGNLFRTEAYLQYGTNISGKVIGTIIMFNPGKSIPRPFVPGELCSSSIDRTMSQITGMISEAFIKSHKEIPDGSRIEIKNLFNLRQPNKEKAAKEFRRLSINALYKKYMYPSYSINNDSLFVWKAWGKELPVKFNSLANKWDLFLKDFKVVGGKDCYHPLYLNVDKRKKANIVNQISRLL